MKITYEIRPEDLIQFNMFHIKEDPRARRTLGIQIGIPILVLFAAMGYFIYTKTLPLAKGLLYFLSVSLLWTLGYHFFFKKTVERRMRRILKKNDYSENFGVKTMEFHDLYLMETTDGRHRKLPYKKVYRAIETRKYLYIYEGPGIAYTIPKEFITEEELEVIKDKLGMKSVFEK